MSRKTTIVWLVVAVGLCIVGIVLLSKGATGGGKNVPLASFSPGSVQSLWVMMPDGRFDKVERGDEPGAWVLLYRVGDREQSWPMETARVRAMLGILADTLSAAHDDPTLDPLGNDAAIVTLSFNEGPALEVRLATRTLGGRGQIEVQEQGSDRVRRAMVDSGLHDALVHTGPKAWRVAQTMPGVEEGVSRIRISSDDQVVALAKVEGHWALTEPVSAAADEQAVNGLVSAIGSVVVDRFLDNERPDDALTGLDNPKLTVRVELDRRVPLAGFVSFKTFRREIRVGGPADLGNRGNSEENGTGEERGGGGGGGGSFVDVDTCVCGSSVPAVVVVRDELLEPFLANPVAYVSRRASRARVADVNSLTVRTHSLAEDGQGDFVYKRTADGWARVAGDQRRLLPADEANRVDALLEMLCETDADDVRFDEMEGFDAEKTVELRDASGGVLDIVEVGTIATRNGTRHRLSAVHTGDVYRLYESESDLWQYIHAGED